MVLGNKVLLLVALILTFTPGSFAFGKRLVVSLAERNKYHGMHGLPRQEGVQHFEKHLNLSPNYHNISLGENDSIKLFLYYQNLYRLQIQNLSLNSVKVLVHMACDHSNVSLSLSPSFSFGDYANGTSVGIVAKRQTRTDDHISVYLKLIGNCSLWFIDQCVITAIPINATQPVPGGCNLVHDLNIYPMIDVTQTHSGSARVKYSMANVGSGIDAMPPMCDSANPAQSRLQYDVYVDFTSVPNSNLKLACQECNNTLCSTNTGYLQAFTNIFTGKTSHSYKVKTMTSGDRGQYHLAAYKCAAMMTYVIVKDPDVGTHTTYVPITISMPESDLSPGAVVAFQAISILLAICGFVLCTIGHRFFVFELFFLSGLFFCLLALCFMEGFGLWVDIDGANFGIVAVIGILGGASITAMWHRFGKAALFCPIIGIVGGFCFASVVFITPLSNLYAFEYRGTFILSFICGCMIYLLLLMVVAKMHRLCIVTSSFVGSYIVVASISYGFWTCSIVGQIIMIMIRKMATVPLLDATIVYPLYVLDYLLIATWGTLFILGIVTQFVLTKDRPPFPLSPRETEEIQPTMDVYQEQSVPTPDNHSVSSEECTDGSVNYDGDVSDQPPEYEDLYPHQDTNQLISPVPQ